MREAEIKRKTGETDVTVALRLDGSGESDIDTGIGFFDHMLHLLSRHAAVDLYVRANGDLPVDDHHTVEDVGIALGQAISRALDEKIGIRRFGQALIPMDEALAEAALDCSGRPFLVFETTFASDRIGAFATQMTEEFFRAVSVHGGLTLHLVCRRGNNDHHKTEALFKAFARALRAAVETDPRSPRAVPSTKGVL